MRRILIASLLAGASVMATTSFPTYASPVQYVKVCDLYGAGWFYIPGTDKCVKPDTGEVRWQSEDGTQYSTIKSIEKTDEGVALSLSLPGATIDAGKTFGVGVNFGTFGGQTAVGVSGAVKAMDGLTLNAAAGVGSQGDAGGRAGVNFSW